MKLRTFLLLLALYFCVIAPLYSNDVEKLVLTLSTGATVDMAPFGVEQLYFTGQAELSTGFCAGAVAPGIRASCAVNNSSMMFRLPAILRVRMFSSTDGFLELSGYGGAGVELYRSELHNCNSLMLTGGVSLLLGWFYVDVPVVSALRNYNTDSDFTVSAGLCLRF